MILLTGGAGYIGSHTAVLLLQHGYDVVIFDNLSNSKAAVISRIERIAGKRPEFVVGNVLDEKDLEDLFDLYKIDAVIHFAGLKAVAESVSQPVKYYGNNVCGGLQLYGAMMAAGVNKIIFSSSATVYGEENPVPYTEDMPLFPVNPYGRTKHINEEILSDICKADPSWSVISLRYFNPGGAHQSGLIGEDPSGIPNNLIPYISKVAAGELEQIHIFGDDYDTPDGTGIRDYIHVMDLARGHMLALDMLLSGEANKKTGVLAINLGTGKGTSVKEIIAAFEKACGKSLPCVIDNRRPGDLASVYADVSLAKELLGFETEYGIDDICDDVWRWEQFT